MGMSLAHMMGIQQNNPTLLSGLMGVAQDAPSFRRIFPSYDWDEDVWRVNQILGLEHTLGKERIGFSKNVPNEEIKKNDAAVKRWIDAEMEGCSCLITFCGEKTYKSRWCLYEMELARQRGLGRFIVNLYGMKNKLGVPCLACPDPYQMNNLYVDDYGNLKAYVIKSYSWIHHDGQRNIKAWIEDACARAGK